MAQSNTFTFLLTRRNFSEAKILVVPGYMVDIPGSNFPARLMISFLSTVRGRVQAGRGAWKERMWDVIYGQKRKLDFVTPEFGGQRVDSHEIRQKILSISYSDWKKLGFSKEVLRYMKQNAKSNKPFTLNSHVLEKG